MTNALPRDPRFRFEDFKNLRDGTPRISKKLVILRIIFPYGVNNRRCVDWAGEHGKGTWEWRAMDIL
jgi:hypothetical protein